MVALSGGLIGSDDGDGTPPNDKRFDYAGSLAGTNVFLGCADVDPHIPIERVHTSAEVLHALGADVDERIYPGLGHTINDDERTAVRDLLARIVVIARRPAHAAAPRGDAEST